MGDAVATDELLIAAIGGDRAALHELLLVHYQPLADHVARRISREHQSRLAAEEIVQQTFVDAIRDIGNFQPSARHAFFAWLKQIAENRIRDAIRTMKAKKRGGGVRQIRARQSPDESFIADLVAELSAGSSTPSRSAARHEAIAAVHDAIGVLPDDYRQAVELRLLDGKSLEETAEVMGRSPRAVQGLIDRARKKMRAALGSLSLYE